MNSIAVKAVLSVDIPLLAKGPRAAQIFDISERKLYALRRAYPDIPTVKIGRDWYYDVPRCYEWFNRMQEINLREG